MTQQSSNPDFSDFQERGGDIVGMWSPNPEVPSPVHFTPLHYNLSDSKKFDKTKPSVLIFGTLESPCDLIAKGDEDDEGDEVVLGQKGDLIGIWAKPGMAALRNLGGVPVLLDFKRDSAGHFLEKDVNKGNLMKLYSVKSKTPGGKLQCQSDRRLLSKGNKHLFDESSAPEAKAGPVPF